MSSSEQQGIFGTYTSEILSFETNHNAISMQSVVVCNYKFGIV
jgi:hypothetical protein